MQRPHVVGGVVHDARIAALCVAHGVEVLLTRDRDFSLVPELRTRDPLHKGPDPRRGRWRSAAQAPARDIACAFR